MSSPRRRILLALNKGAVITVEYVRDGTKTKKMYRLSSTSEAIRASVVTSLLIDDLIKPNNDGLPGIGEAQSYSLWRASDGGA